MRIMAVFAHPDDELGCVGSLKKHAERGDEVMFVWTTFGEMASQFVEHSAAEVKAIRQDHGAFVADKIGASYHFFDMGDSRMTGSREEGLALARLYASFKPDAVITWSDDHPHPDHRMTAKIAFDAITLARIPKIINENSDELFEAHRNPVHFYQYNSAAFSRPVVHVDISEQIDTSVELFAYYQRFYGWEHTPEAYKEGRALLGRESAVRFAEKFQYRANFAAAKSYLV